MQIITDPGQFQDLCFRQRCAGVVTALVPTMGFYHEGHLELMRWARQNADLVVVSLFVNPAQFGPNEDFSTYPRDFERDRQLAEEQGVDILFAPKASDLYPDNHATWVNVPELSRNLCGQSRPHFFQGVCTVVCKLLNLALPTMAVFGEKDRQQLIIVTRMVQDLNLPVRIVGRPTVREDDGLAMSSRNAYLSREERQQAAGIYAGLNEASAWAASGVNDTAEIVSRLRDYYARNIPSGRIDYVELVDPESLEKLDTVGDRALLAVAVHLGQARLIDNIILSPAGLAATKDHDCS